MQILCTVDIRTRELYLEDVTIAAFDHLVDDVLFVIEPIDGFQLETSTIKIAAVGPLGEPHDYEIDPSTVTVDEETGNINFVWSIPVGVTAMPLTAFKISDTKNITFAVCAEIVSGDNLVKAWHSDDGTIKVKAHLEPESGGGEDPSEEATNAQKIGQLQTDVAVVQREVAAVAGGTPTVVDAKADMTEHDKIYILSSDSKWYYYSSTASDWLAGGTYGGVPTDTTLSISGSAADAKAVGDAVDALDDRVTVLESGSSGGLTADIKSALLACFAHVAWEGTDGQDFYDALDAALNPPAGLVSISAVYTQSGTVYDTASLDSLKSDLVVTAHYDNATTEAITNYSLSGTLTEGTSTITVSFGGKTTTFTVTVTSLTETITVTWSGTGTGKQTGVIDARTADVYWTLPFIEGDSAYASGVTWESDFVGIGASLYNDSTAETAVGYYYIDTEQIESSARTSINRPSMPCNTQIKVAPHGYYVKIFAAIRSGFTSNSTGLTFLNNNANTVKLMGVGG